jgi:CheY-like chemotaxis protein
MMGLDVLDRARAQAPGAVRVLLTGNADHEEARRAIADGRIHAHFQKPVELRSFCAAIAGLILAQPAVPPEAPARPTPEPAAAAGTRRILVVDDVFEVADLFARFAERMPGGPAEVVAERDAQEARRKIETESFDAIVSDYRMPRLSGVELLIVAKRVQPQAWRVLVTGYNEVPEDPLRLAQADVDAYVHKPIKAKDVLMLLEAACGRDPGLQETLRAQARLIEKAATRDGAPVGLDDA